LLDGDLEEAKDLNTLSVEDLISSLTVHEISLNEHEPAKKSRSIALPSKGKSSKALKVVDSEEESPDGRVASTARSMDTSLLIALIFRKKNQRRSLRNQLSNQANSRSRSSRV